MRIFGADYETMCDEILRRVKAASPLDDVLHGLHGATVAHGHDATDADGNKWMRAQVGPNPRARRGA
jgi:microcystin degradation protein MlrC